MKNLQILFWLALIAYLADAVSFGGLSNITIAGNEDPGACNLTLTVDVQADKVVFNEAVANPNSDCTYQNLQFAPNIRGDGLGGNVTLSKIDSDSYSGSINMTDIVNASGKYCGNLGDNGAGADFWACNFKYGQIYFVIALFVNKNSSQFETTWSDVFFTRYGITNVNSVNGTNFITPNSSYPDLIARLPNGFWSWDNTVTNLSQPIYVIGTVQLSNQVNLTTYLSDLSLVAIGYRKVDQSYIAYQPNDTFYPFSSDKQGPNNGTDIGLTWAQPLSSLNDCVDGCNVTLVLEKGSQIYILQTGGIKTKPARRLRA